MASLNTKFKNDLVRYRVEGKGKDLHSRHKKIYIPEKEVGKISCNVGESRAFQSCNVLDSNLSRERIVNARSAFVSMRNSNLISTPYTL